MANAYLIKCKAHGHVKGYAIRDGEQDSYLSHTLEEGEPTDAEGALARLSYVGVPPDGHVVWLIAGNPLDTLLANAAKNYGEPVELEYIGSVHAE
jgi:hypothetical protein